MYSFQETYSRLDKPILTNVTHDNIGRLPTFGRHDALRCPSSEHDMVLHLIRRPEVTLQPANNTKVGITLRKIEYSFETL
jgi:hypothetical protein